MLNKAIWTASRLSLTTIIAVSSMLSVGSFAQDNEFVEEVVSIGTRGKPRSVSSSPVPVDVLSAEDISKTGTDDLLMQLQGSVPSLNVHLQPISDAASMIRPANLRGLSADATLIFTNGRDVIMLQLLPFKVVELMMVHRVQIFLSSQLLL